MQPYVHDYDVFAGQRNSNARIYTYLVGFDDFHMFLIVDYLLSAVLAAFELIVFVSSSILSVA